MKPDECLAKYAEWLDGTRLADLTKESYMGWAERFCAFKDPAKADSAEQRLSNFLSTYSEHTEATVNQAVNALAGKSGFYAGLDYMVGDIPAWTPPTRPFRIPVWVTPAEAEAIIAQLDEPWATICGLLFGSGLRIGECVSLRWRDFDFERLTVTIRGGKGDKDRVTVLSRRLIDALKARMERCRALWEEDRIRKRPGVALPPAVGRKCPSFSEEWPYFWVFPAAGESRDKKSGIVRRHHIHRKSLARPLRPAVRRAKLNKRVTAHSFRHGFATLYLLSGGNLRELQRLMGHESMTTTERYLHLIPSHTDRIGSPWDVAIPQANQIPSNIVMLERAI